MLIIVHKVANDLLSALSRILTCLESRSQGENEPPVK